MAKDIQFGLRIDSTEPVDSRFVVQNSAARLGFNSDVLYEGLTVYQSDDNHLYVLTDVSQADQESGWHLIASTDATVSLNDIAQSGATDGQVPVWSDDNNAWEPGAGGGGGGNSFGTITAGGATIVADQANDTLAFGTGAGIVINGDATNDSVTIRVADTVVRTTGDYTLDGNIVFDSDDDDTDHVRFESNESGNGSCARFWNKHPTSNYAMEIVGYQGNGATFDATGQRKGIGRVRHFSDSDSPGWGWQFYGQKNNNNGVDELGYITADGYMKGFTWKANDIEMEYIEQDGATSGQVLAWNGSNWRPATLTASGDGNHLTTGISAGNLVDMTTTAADNEWARFTDSGLEGRTNAELLTDIGITSTATELNLVDGSSAGTVVNSKAVIYSSAGDVAATTITLGGTSITSTAAEINKLDGVGTLVEADGTGIHNTPTDGQVVAWDNDNSRLEWVDASSGGGDTVSIATSLADIFSVSSGEISADDLTADRLYGWDDSASKAVGFTATNVFDFLGLPSSLPSDPGADTNYVLQWDDSESEFTWAQGSGGSYTLPTAADGTKGGVELGYTSDDNNRALQVDSDDEAFVNIPDASGTVTGLLTHEAQTIGGAKTFSNSSLTLSGLDSLPGTSAAPRKSLRVDNDGNVSVIDAVTYAEWNKGTIFTGTGAVTSITETVDGTENTLSVIHRHISIDGTNKNVYQVFTAGIDEYDNDVEFRLSSTANASAFLVHNFSSTTAIT